MPFFQLDALYHHILASVADWKRVLEILLCILHLDLETSYTVLQAVYGYQVGEVQTILCGMHSLLDIPDGTNIKAKFNFHHKSMVDFLLDHSPSRISLCFPFQCNVLYSCIFV